MRCATTPEFVDGNRAFLWMYGGKRGGSCVFLIGCSSLRRQGAAVAAVSSTRNEDLVAVARQSMDLNTSRA
jgi:hypothetical protein